MTREEIIEKINNNLKELENGNIRPSHAATILNYLKTLLKELDNEPLMIYG
jgi:hypothetical protein